MNLKYLLALSLAFGIGIGCRRLGIPVPAPTALLGALLVLAMTSGYLLADAIVSRRTARHGPDERVASGASRTEPPR